MEKLIIAANLGKVRVLKYRAAGEDPIEQDHLVETPEKSSEFAVQSVQQAVTDQAGRFGRGAPVGFETGMSYGEEHNLEREMERTAIKRIADRIEQVLQTEGHPTWTLAAPQSVLARLREALPRAAANTLSTTIGSDLTQCRLQEMERRFL